jgi:hypothetical protein
MIGGFGYKAAAPKQPSNSKKVTIKVGGRVLESDEPVNLRKILQSNKVDVYPLAGKLSNWYGKMMTIT